MRTIIATLALCFVGAGCPTPGDLPPEVQLEVRKRRAHTMAAAATAIALNNNVLKESEVELAAEVVCAIAAEDNVAVMFDGLFAQFAEQVGMDRAVAQIVFAELEIALIYYGHINPADGRLFVNETTAAILESVCDGIRFAANVSADDIQQGEADLAAAQAGAAVLSQ